MSSSFRARVARTLALAAAAGVAICLALAEVTVNPRIVQLDAFEVMGIAVRTNNAKEASADGVIPKLWQRVMQEHALNTVPDPADQNIYAVYTDYASDANGDYTLVLGKKVPPGNKARRWIRGENCSRRSLCGFYFGSRTGSEGCRRNLEADLVLLPIARRMVSERTARILNCTISVRSIPTTHKWTSISE